MSIHPSLALNSATKKQRAVLTRIEKIKHLKEKGLFNEETSDVYGLPKIKYVRLKIKKEKAAEKPAEAAQTAPGTAAGTTPAAQEKPAKGQPAAKAAK